MNQSLTQLQFKSLQQLLEEEAGLYFGDHNRGLLERRIDRFITGHKLSHNEFLNIIKNDKEMRGDLIEVLTVNETYFFRESDHYTLTSGYFIPELLKKGRTEIRILSMASSTGEEAYSIKIELLEHFPSLRNIYIDCVDISGKVIKRAEKGEFKGRSFKMIDNQLKSNYFDRRDDNVFTVKPELKKNITFTPLNLFNLKNFDRKYDIIFCRNLLIYFRREKKLEALKILSSLIHDKGFLVIGTTETLYTIIGEFKLSKWNNISYYRKMVDA